MLTQGGVAFKAVAARQGKGNHTVVHSYTTTHAAAPTCPLGRMMRPVGKDMKPMPYPVSVA